MSDTERTTTSTGLPAVDEPGTARTVPAEAGATPVLSMLADDGAACVDGVCALPEHGTR